MQPAYPKGVWPRRGTPPHSMGGTAHRPVHFFWHQEDPQTGFSRRPSVTQSYTGLPLLPGLTAAKCPLMTAIQSSIHSPKARVVHMRQVQHSRVYGCFAHSGPAIDDGSRRGQRSTRSSTFVTRANGRSTSPTPISSNQISRRVNWPASPGSLATLPPAINHRPASVPARTGRFMIGSDCHPPGP